MESSHLKAIRDRISDRDPEEAGQTKEDVNEIDPT